MVLENGVFEIHDGCDSSVSGLPSSVLWVTPHGSALALYGKKTDEL